MELANRFIHPINYYGTYKTNSWAGYNFKENLNGTGRYEKPWHTGVDYNGAGGGNSDLGFAISSIANGVVRWVGNMTSSGYGNMTIVQYYLSPTLKKELGCDSLFARYMHQNTIEVSAGQEVKIGQRIGTVGNTGTTYAHLHLDLYKDTIEDPDVHFRYDKNTDLVSYLDGYPFIDAHQTAVDVTTLKGFQRRVSNGDGVNGRALPNTASAILSADGEFKKGDVLDFKGYVRGQDPYGGGNIYWLVGAYRGWFFYTGSFEDTDLHDLPDLTDVLFPPVVTPPVVVPPTDAYPVPSIDPLVTVVVNKKNPLAPLEYVPSDLVSAGNGQTLRKEAADAFILMQTAAARAGAHLIPTSGYRSFDTQKAVYDGYVATDGIEKADTYSARPGYSEHQTGLALDITGSGVGLVEAFAQTPESKWLVDNAYKFGYVLRYPTGSTEITGYTFEPWHYRFIGVSSALDYRLGGKQTLEEYFGVVGGDYATPVPDPEDPTPSEPPHGGSNGGDASDIDKENNSLLKSIKEMLQGLIDAIKSIFKFK